MFPPPYQNIPSLIKSLPIIGSPSPEKSPSADNLPVKIRPVLATAGRGGFLPLNCQPGETFLEGDLIMRHRRWTVLCRPKISVIAYPDARVVLWGWMLQAHTVLWTQCPRLTERRTSLRGSSCQFSESDHSRLASSAHAFRRSLTSF